MTSDSSNAACEYKLNSLMREPTASRMKYCVAAVKLVSV